MADERHVSHATRVLRRGRPGAFEATAALAHLLSLACRLAALALTALVVLSAVVTGAGRLTLVGYSGTVTSWLPDGLAGRFVFETPLGGVLRGDFALAALALFVTDWLLARLAHALRSRRG
ncbi:hypothetical protein [Olsenella massiliensis]|uniref:hypothetical protein n=1 Tax=Olsenella massiliensis TaxID=1622075 RepID=UPI00071E25BD|nr:hypothetical protein [Olsenella massiliensis]